MCVNLQNTTHSFTVQEVTAPRAHLGNYTKNSVAQAPLTPQLSQGPTYPQRQKHFSASQHGEHRPIASKLTLLVSVSSSNSLTSSLRKSPILAKLSHLLPPPGGRTGAGQSWDLIFLWLVAPLRLVLPKSQQVNPKVGNRA